MRSVAATSLYAYRTTNLSETRAKVAHAILRATMAGRPIAAFQIEQETGLKCNQVSGRIGNLKEMKENRVPITFDSRRYEIHQLDKPIYNPETGKPAQAYSLILFDSEPKAGEQTNLFNQ